MPWGNKQPDLKNDPTYLEPRVTAVESSLAEKALQSDLNTTNENVATNTSAIASNSSQITANTTAISNIGNGSPKGTYATVTALQTAFPTGTTGVYVVIADGGWYYWSGSAWTKGGTYQGTALTRTNADANLIVELNSDVENNIYRNFEFINSNYFSDGDITYYNKVFGAIYKIKLTGFDTTKKTKLRLIARNHATYNYRFIISQFGTVWSDVFDAGSSFTVTENPNGLTYVTYTIGTKTVEIWVDYSRFPATSSNQDGGLTDGRYVIKSTCFYENTLDYTKSDISRLHYSSMGRIFLLNDSTYKSSTDISQYDQYFGAIRKLTLTGFDTSKKTRIRYLARNYSTSGTAYRFIISQFGSVWSDVFDSGAGYTVTENTNGLTQITCTIGTKTVDMLIDYNQIPNNSVFSEDNTGARLYINPNCFYENTVDKVKSDVTQLQTSTKSMYAKKSGNSYKVKFRYGISENMIMEWNQLGINQLIHPRYIYRETSQGLTSDFSSPPLWYTVGTDWISPYAGITALTGTTTTFTGTVGGNHGTNSSGGFPTARNISATMYADEKLMNDGDVLSCDKVVLIVKNFISASNKIDVNTGTKADSLEELVTYTITSNNVEVSVYLTALEDLTINGYTGLQMTTDMIAGQAYFNDSANKYSPDGTEHDSLSAPFNEDRMVYGDANNIIVTYTNRNTGLGNLSAKGTAPVFFLATDKKIYAHLITNPVTVLTNNSVFYSGGYTFDVPMACSGAEKAYSITLNGTKIYCADFLAAVSNTYFQTPTDCLGKEIEIVEKSNSITCDSMICGKGLKISASDYGTLKFKIKS